MDPAINIVTIQQQMQVLSENMRRCGQEDLIRCLVAMGTISHNLQEIQRWIIDQQMK
jgi:hypothetical protein